jgi:stress-induced morphogen
MATDLLIFQSSFFKVKVVSPDFQGKSPLQRQRLVIACLKEEFADVHGFNIECATPPS